MTNHMKAEVLAMIKYMDSFELHDEKAEEAQKKLEAYASLLGSERDELRHAMPLYAHPPSAQENAEDARDAARLDWLQSTMNGVDPVYPSRVPGTTCALEPTGEWVIVARKTRGAYKGSSLRDVIDKAMTDNEYIQRCLKDDSERGEVDHG